MDLEKSFIKLSNHPRDQLTLRDFVRGVQGFGGIGSGKTSGSGRAIARAFLKNILGGIVLCAKPDERENWERLAEELGRTDDLIIFEEDGPYSFNPLSYEINRKGKGAGESYNLVNLFMNIYQMGRGFSGEGMAKESDRFWDNALKRCIRRMIDLLMLAKEDVSVLNMQRLISSTLNKDEITSLKSILSQGDNNKAYNELSSWAKRNYYIECYLKAAVIDSQEDEYGNDNSPSFQFKSIRNYFEREFGNLSDRTRTIIIESFLGIAEPFLGGVLKKHFAGETTIYPEWTYERSKIIILDFPIKNYLDAGVYAQGIFKLLFQQAMERRSYKAGIDKPVFLWVDESQLFLNDYDQTFQTTARSSGTCTVFLSQNISNYYSAMGGKDPRPKVDSLLANLSIKIFHANNDSVTNEWAANVIGKKFRQMKSVNVSEHESATLSEQLHYQVEPATFSELNTGGKHIDNPNLDYKVEGIMTVTGKIWSNNKNYIKIRFSQK